MINIPLFIDFPIVPLIRQAPVMLCSCKAHERFFSKRWNVFCFSILTSPLYICIYMFWYSTTKPVWQSIPSCYTERHICVDYVNLVLTLRFMLICLGLWLCSNKFRATLNLLESLKVMKPDLHNVTNKLLT